MPSATEITELAEAWNQKVGAARKAGDIAAILATGQAAVDALETAIGPTLPLGKPARAALKTLRKMTYNAAADIYPGWEVDTPPRSATELAGAKGLARKSLGLVERLREDGEHRGHALWLIGALCLAQDRAGEALALFRAAADAHKQAGSVLMTAVCEGYIGVAAADEAGFDAAIGKIAGLEDKYSKDMIEQLATARRVFGRP